MLAPQDYQQRRIALTNDGKSSPYRRNRRSLTVSTLSQTPHWRSVRRAQKRMPATRSPLAAPVSLLPRRSRDTLPASTRRLPSAFDKALPKRIAEVAGFLGWRALHHGSDPPNAPLFGRPRQNAGRPPPPANGSFVKSHIPPAS